MERPVHVTSARPPPPPPAGTKYGTCRSHKPYRRRSSYHQAPRRTASKNRPRPVVARIAAILLVLGALTVASLAQYSPFGWLLGQETPTRAVSMSEPSSPLVSAVGGQVGELRVRQYNLSLGQRWVNPDGGGWWPRTTCNGRFSCPVLHAEEGEILRISLLNKPISQEYPLVWYWKRAMSTSCCKSHTPGMQPLHQPVGPPLAFLPSLPLASSVRGDDGFNRR
ncbi:hypothetical protein GGTG_07734 [Gaeumannomyces tritici R3-111a-1]|uniref:Uncharacterized protein n=1 Tax=Gaeumannomyces tritici (strain R3-111a-1) TaxID=644352 RepID=J3P2I8_GAET3|nr:hypothetical protein GGTG_07734 [Gaeumannomyces tritici R3-111a-1]EJT73880.1 hypothetical protein GGTG_07734 [Gaeumannomyces tritici R3-111a-1]